MIKINYLCLKLFVLFFFVLFLIILITNLTFYEDKILNSFIFSLFFSLLISLITYFFGKYFLEHVIKMGKLIKFNKILKEKNRHLKEILNIDLLTKLPNRFALDRCLPTMEFPKVFVIKIDDFISIISYFKESICHEILIKFSLIIKKFGDENGLLTYRISDNKFALVQDTDLFFDDYENLLMKMVDSFKCSNIIVKDGNKDLEVKLYSTIGFCLEKGDSVTKAIIALKKAELAGRDFLCYFQNIDDIYRYKTRIKHSYLISSAIVYNQVTPYYQPIFDKDKNIIKYETLIRIITNDNGIILPGIFLEDSKHLKHYAQIEKILIEKTFMAVRDNKGIILSINIGIRDMLDGDVSAFLLSKLSEFGIANRIIFEILEDEKMRDSQRVENFLVKVRRMGAKIAIDDFGSGYNNFSYFLSIKPDYIKIDGSIVKDIDVNDNSYAITSAIVAFAKKLGVTTIAEFVHSKEVFDKCVEVGVDEFQGFYLGEPSDKFLSQ